MFTGIITDIGTIIDVEARGDRRLRIACAYDLAKIDLGASVACSGVCLTVVDKAERWFAVDVSAETERRTAPGMWEQGRRLNLERSLRLGDELGGHIVTGHVDGVAELVAAEPAGASTALTFAAPRALAGYIAPKGSIALDGVSLTVNQVEDAPDAARFGINLIPHTAAQTTFAELSVGRGCNLEIDVIARYLGRIVEARAALDAASR